MELLTRMMELQESHGAVTDGHLRELSREMGIPLYRLEGLRGFYPVFRKEHGAPTRVQVCRDIACAMKGGAGHCAEVTAALRQCRGEVPRQTPLTDTAGDEGPD